MREEVNRSLKWDWFCTYCIPQPHSFSTKSNLEVYYSLNTGGRYNSRDFILYILWIPTGPAFEIQTRDLSTCITPFLLHTLLCPCVLIHLLSSYSYTGVKQCTFQWLISNNIAHKEMVFNGSIIHHLIIITCIRCEIKLTISLPKLINIGLL